MWSMDMAVALSGNLNCVVEMNEDRLRSQNKEDAGAKGLQLLIDVLC
ncbi:hypothetical protein PI125_g24461 [Phytophthora idaei]|nr:hypothetical protein PI125_g24461 [Phytophthora idaei]